MNSGIYTIRFAGTDGFYVGKTINFRKRTAFHLWQLKRGVHHNERLQNCFKKYGTPKFCLVELIGSKDTMTEREQFWLDQYADSPDLLNICKVSVLVSTYRSPDGIQRTAWNKGIPSPYKGVPRSAAVRERISLSRRGKPVSNETCQRLSEAHKGQVPWNKGQSMSDEFRTAVSAAQTGKKRGPRSDEARRKISESRKGIVFSEETRAKMSKAARERRKAA